jgi:hypothetical protein
MKGKGDNKLIKDFVFFYSNLWVIYSDSDWGGDVEMSTTGFVFRFGSSQWRTQT